MSEVYYCSVTPEEIKQQELVQRYEHPERNILFNASRFALCKIMASKFQKHISLDEIKVYDYHQIQGHDELSCSLSHSKSLGVAAIGNKNHFQGIGIDLEFKNREIKTGSERFFVNERDRFSTDNLLLKWCIKEACFKALSNSGAKIELLKEVVIQEEFFYFDSAMTAPKNHYTIIEDEEKFIVLALCKQSENIPVKIIEVRNH